MAKDKKFKTLMEMDETWQGATKSPMADEHSAPTEPPPPEPEQPGGPPSIAMLRIDPKKFLKAWEDNVDTSRAIVSAQLEQQADNIATRQSNSRTRWEMRIGVVILAIAAVWIVVEQRATRATIKIGARTLDRVDNNVASMTTAQMATQSAMAKKAEASITRLPEAEEEALWEAYNAQEEIAEAAIKIAETRKEAPPPKAVKARDSARKKRHKLKRPPKIELPSISKEEFEALPPPPPPVEAPKNAAKNAALPPPAASE